MHRSRRQRTGWKAKVDGPIVWLWWVQRKRLGRGDEHTLPICEASSNVVLEVADK